MDLEIKVAKERVRATRYVPTQNLVVASKTIGTDLTFNLKTYNLSRTGMLLGWEQMRPIPFIENTILELSIDPGNNVLRKPVHCLGKVVRRSGKQGHTSASDLSFGICIIQMDHADLEHWESCLAELAAAGAASVDSAPSDTVVKAAKAG